jgi:hypothetical protein
MVRLPIRWTLALCFALLVTALGQARAGEEKPPEKPADASVAEEKKPSLAEVTRVSTTAAAENAAREQVRSEDEASEAEIEGSTSGEDSDSVVELKPRSKNSEESKEAVKVDTRSSGKGPLKDVHGSVHGTLDAKGSDSRRTGGSIGATTRDGRGAIYVEGQRTRETPPRPQ